MTQALIEKAVAALFAGRNEKAHWYTVRQGVLYMNGEPLATRDTVRPEGSRVVNAILARNGFSVKEVGFIRDERGYRAPVDVSRFYTVAELRALPFEAVPKVAGCEHIAESIAKGFFSPFFEELQSKGGPEAGTPPRMPTPDIKPAWHTYHAIAEALEGLPATWCRVESQSQYGVYYTAIALFGTSHWLTRDRSGAVCLRVYKEDFTK